MVLSNPPLQAQVDCLPPTCADWTRKRPITISGATENLIDYQVRVSVPYDADMQPDFDDLRFADSSGNQLGYWIESSIPSTNAKVWFKLPSIPANTSIMIDMFYGNPAAASASNGNATFEFFDDFNGPALDASKWTVVGEVTQGGGILTIGDANNDTELLTSVPSFGENVVLTAQALLPSEGLSYSTLGFDHFGVGAMQRWEDKGSTYFIFDGTATSAIDTNVQFAGAFHRFEIRRKGGGAADLLVNGILRASVSSGALGTRLPIGAHIHTANNFTKVDWLFVRKFTAREPNVSFGKEFKACSAGETRLCETQFGVCNGSFETCDSSGFFLGCDFSTIPNYSTTDACDRLDNNCDGQIDEDFNPAICTGDWTKSSSILINGVAQDLQNYQVLIPVTYDAAMQPDFDDLRFVDSAAMHLPYWIESFIPSASAKVWLKVPQIPANTSVAVSLFFGNPAAPSGSDGGATFLLFDDFDAPFIDAFHGPALDMNKWTVIGEVSQSEGILTIGDANNDMELLTSVPRFGENVALTTKALLPAEGISFSTLGFDHFGVGPLQKWQDKGSTHFIYNGEVQLSINTNIQFAGAFHRFETRRKGRGAADLLVDEVLRAGVSSGALPSAFPIASHTHTANNLIKVDWLFVRKLTDPEPAVCTSNCGLLGITTESLPLAGLGVAFSERLGATLGSPPYSWSLVSGALPPGMSLSADGVLSGTPTEVGIFTFSVRVTDSLGSTAEKTLSQEVRVTLPPPDLRITKWGSVAVPGRVLDYFILVENMGNVPANNVEVVEQLDPTLFTLHSTDPPAEIDAISPADASMLIWNIPALDAGAYQVLTYRAELRSTTALGSDVIGGPVCTRPDANKKKCACTDFDGTCKDSQAIQTLTSCVEGKMAADGINPGQKTTHGGSHVCSSYHFGGPQCTNSGIGALAADYGLGGGSNHDQDPVNCQGIEARSGPKVLAMAQECGAGTALQVQVVARCENALGQTLNCNECSVNHVHMEIRSSSSCSPVPGGFPICNTHQQQARAPLDPNEKGVTAPPFIAPDQRLVYPIHFENIGDTEAKDVFLTDTLDTDLDLATVQVFKPGEGFVSLPVDQTFLLKAVEHTRTINVGGVPVEQTFTETWSASLDSATRTLRFELVNIFLPPQQGDSVLVSVKPNPNLASGTQIRNAATIQFEIFAPLMTNEVVNTIDLTPPGCIMNPLPTQSASPQISLSWSGVDTVGKIDTYALFVEEDNGGFKLFTATSDTRTTFAGQINKSYGFICIARDTAGNTEVQDPVAEATTSTFTNQPPVAHVGGPYTLNEGSPLSLDASASSDPDGDPLTFTWDVKRDSVFGDATGVTPILTWSNLGNLGINDNGSFTVTVRVEDGKGRLDEASTTLTVNNAAPSANIDGPAEGFRGNTLAFTLGASDPSPADQTAGFTYEIDWDGNGIVDQTTAGPTGLLVNHLFSDAGSFTVQVTATDKDGGKSSAVTHSIVVIQPVTIDIKPGSDPNSINLGSTGTVPVGIFSTTDFDATTIDPTTVTLANAKVKLRGKGTPMSSDEDLNGDGLLDLVVHVETEALTLTEGDTEAVLQGQTFTGIRLRGTDSVRIVP